MVWDKMDQTAGCATPSISTFIICGLSGYLQFQKSSHGVFLFLPACASSFKMLSAVFHEELLYFLKEESISHTFCKLRVLYELLFYFHPSTYTIPCYCISIRKSTSNTKGLTVTLGVKCLEKKSSS